MAAAAAVTVLSSAVPAARQNSFFTGTPEIYFAKAIDNSRLVKMEDAGRTREMKQFGTALVVLFLLVFTYTWQHFRARDKSKVSGSTRKVPAYAVVTCERLFPNTYSLLSSGTLNSNSESRRPPALVSPMVSA